MSENKNPILILNLDEISKQSDKLANDSKEISSQPFPFDTVIGKMEPLYKDSTEISQALSRLSQEASDRQDHIKAGIFSRLKMNLNHEKREMLIAETQLFTIFGLSELILSELSKGHTEFYGLIVVVSALIAIATMSHLSALHNRNLAKLSDKIELAELSDFSLEINSHRDYTDDDLPRDV